MDIADILSTLELNEVIDVSKITMANPRIEILNTQISNCNGLISGGGPKIVSDNFKSYVEAIKLIPGGYESHIRNIKQFKRNYDSESIKNNIGFEQSTNVYVSDDETSESYDYSSIEIISHTEEEFLSCDDDEWNSDVFSESTNDNSYESSYDVLYELSEENINNSSYDSSYDNY